MFSERDKQELEWMRARLTDADPAALLVEAAVGHAASKLVAEAEPRVPFLGSETDPRMLLHPMAMCVECGKETTVQHSMGTTATILGTDGPFQKQHTPRRCYNPECNKHLVMQWHNYIVKDGRHEVVGKVSEMRCFMMTSRFGVTVAYLRQLQQRMLREHVSFAGEADVARACAKDDGKAGLLPGPHLRLYLSEAWFMWRAALRLQEIHADSLADTADLKWDERVYALDLLQPVEAVLAQHMSKLEEAFEARTAKMAEESGTRLDVMVMDGNAKNRRLVCAARLRNFVRCKRLGKLVRVCCPATPVLGKQFCRAHMPACGREGETSSLDFEIKEHEEQGAVSEGAQRPLRFLIQEKSGDHREVWVDETLLPEDKVSEYFRRVGQEKLAQAAAKRARKNQKRKAEFARVQNIMAGLAGQWEQLSDEEKTQAMQDRSAPEDLDAVGCSTHKESEELERLLEKTAGILCACTSSGLVVLLKEMYGCESLSQRYIFVSQLKALYPQMRVVVHDDACHMHRFTDSRREWNEVAAGLAPPAVMYACDGFHMTGHVDPWCLAHCNPKAPHLEPLLRGIRTSVCEFTFTWLSQYKHQTKHMSQNGFKFFLLEMVDAHNRAIQQGSTNHLTHMTV